MLLKIAFVLLIGWMLGVLGLYRIGDLVHVLLLIGLMLLLLGALKARDAAAARESDVAQVNHDHSVQSRQLPRVRAPTGDNSHTEQPERQPTPRDGGRRSASR